MRSVSPLVSLHVLKIATALAVVGAAPVADARVRLEPKISVRQSYSDNLSLNDLNKDGGLTTTIAPGFQLTFESPRVQGSINYELNYRVGIGTKIFDKFRHNGIGRVNAVLVPEFLYLETGAVATLLTQDPRGSLSTNPDNNNRNVNNTFSGFVGPYVRQRIGDFANLQAGYRFSATFPENQQNSAFLGTGDVLNATRQFGADSTNHNFYATLSSGTAFQRFRWTASAGYEAENIQDATRERFRSRNVNLSGEYPLNRYFSLLGSVGYEKSRSTVLDTIITPANDPLTGLPVPGTVAALQFGPGRVQNYGSDGLIWDGGFRFSPSPRTEISVRGGRRFGDTTINVSGFKKLGKKSQINVSYGDRLDSLGRLLTREIAGISTSSALVGQYRTGVFPLSFNDPVTGLFSNGRLAINSATYRSRTASIGYQFVNSPWSVGGSIFRQRRQLLRITQLPNQPPLAPGVLTRNDSSLGANINASRSYSAGHSIDLNILAERNSFALVEARRDNFWSARLGYNYKLSPQISLSTSALHSERRSSQAFSNATENAVSIGVNVTF